MKILLTRHGETYDNLEHLLTGQKEVNLTEKWLSEAKNLAKKLNKYSIDYIYCSTLQRAKDTISPYLSQHTTPIEYINELREMNLGIYNGATEEEAKHERSISLEHKVGWWESLYELYNRANTLFEILKQKHNNETVLLVWHNAINRNIIGIIKNYSIEEINQKKERYPNAEIIEFDI